MIFEKYNWVQGHLGKTCVRQQYVFSSSILPSAPSPSGILTIQFIGFFMYFPTFIYQAFFSGKGSAEHNFIIF
jgi:hypothetical protein